MQHPLTSTSSHDHQPHRCAAVSASLCYYDLRADDARCQALPEIDVLVVQPLGMTLDAGTFDSLESPGRSKHDITFGWEDIQHLPAGSKVRKTFKDDTLPGGPFETTLEYTAPFFKPDREEDCRRAWAFFAEKRDS